MLKIANNSLENLLILIGVPKKDEVGDRGVSGFKIIVVLFISMLRTINSSENLLTLMDRAEKNEVGK